MNELIEFLSKGTHPVELTRYHNLDHLKQSLDEGVILLKFTDTRGGTELSIKLGEEYKGFDNTQEKLHILGSLILNYVNVKCNATIDMKSYQGQGNLEIM